MFGNVSPLKQTAADNTQDDGDDENRSYSSESDDPVQFITPPDAWVLVVWGFIA